MGQTVVTGTEYEVAPVVLFSSLCVVFLIVFVVQVFVAWTIASCLQAVPAEFRRQEPGMAWLILIPLFHLVWNFFVHPRLADSYAAYFAAMGDDTVGDSGRNVALWYCICAIGACVPCLNYIAAPAMLVLLVLWLVKAVQLKNRIRQGGGWNTSS